MRQLSTLLGKLLFRLVLVLSLLFLIAPAVVVLILSVSNDPSISFPPASWGTRNFATLVDTPKWGAAALLSLGLGMVVAVIAALIAVPAVFAVQRTRLAAFKPLPFLAMLPLLIPQSAYAIGMYVMMTQAGLLGSPLALGAAQVAVCFPFVFVIVRSHFARLPPDLDLVAMTMGASRLRAWTGITLRLLLPAILAGGLFAFLTSFDEAVFANFLAGPGLQTLPKLIFDSVRLGVDPVITAIAALLMVFTALIMGLATFLRSRGQT